MTYNTLFTAEGNTLKKYSIEKWRDDSTTPASTWKYPAQIRDLDKGHQLDQWETADNPNQSFSTKDDPIDIAIEGLERLLIEHHINPVTITVTRHAPFSASELEAATDIDCGKGIVNTVNLCY